MTTGEEIIPECIENAIEAGCNGLEITVSVEKEKQLVDKFFNLRSGH